MDLNLDLFHQFAHEDCRRNVAVSNQTGYFQTGQSPGDDIYLWSNLKKSLTWQVKPRFGWSQTQQLAQCWQRTIVSLLEKLHSLQWDESAWQSHIVLSAPMAVLCCLCDFKQMKISLMLLLLGGEQCCPKAERGAQLCGSPMSVEFKARVCESVSH